MAQGKKNKQAADPALASAQLQEELKPFHQALAAAREQKNQKAEAQAWLDLAQAYQNRWHQLKISAIVAAREDAILAYRTATVLLQDLEDLPAEIEARLAWAAFLHQVELQADARIQFELSLKLADSLAMPDHMLAAHLGLIDTLLAMEHLRFGLRFTYISHHVSHTQIEDPGLVEAAWQSCLAAEKLAQAVGSSADRARLQLNMGIIRLKRQDTLAAIPNFKAAWASAKEARNKPIRAAVAENLSLVYSSLKDWTAVQHYAQLARKLRAVPIELTWQPTPREHLRFMADGQHLVYLSRFGLAQVWRLADGARSQQIATGSYKHAALSQDGRLVATVADNLLRVWQTLTGELVLERKLPGRIAGLAIRPDNQLLLTFHYLELAPEYTQKGTFPFARFWDLATGQQVGAIELPPPGLCGLAPLHLAADWQTLVIGLIYESPYGYDRVRVHILALQSEPPYYQDGTTDRVARLQAAAVTAVAIALEGSLVALAISAEANSYLRQTAAQRFELWRPIRHHPSVPLSLLKTVINDAISVPLELLMKGLRSLSYARPRPRSQPTTEPFLERLGGDIEQSMAGYLIFKKQLELPGASFRSRWLLLSPSADLLISGNQDGSIQLLPQPFGTRSRILQQHERAVTLGILNPDGQQLATTDERGQLVFWELPAGTCQHTTTFPLPLTTLAVSADGQFLAASRQDGQITIFSWDKPQAEPRCFAPPADF